MVLDDPAEAQNYYEKVVSDHPNSSYANKALNQLGLIYYNAGEL